MFGLKVSQRFLRKTAANNGIRAVQKAAFSSYLTNEGEDYSVETTESKLQFSKAPILKNFGELPAGEIPATLNHVKETHQTLTSNGIRVASERSSGQIAGVSVFINAGSRHETSHEESGASFLNSALATQGNSFRNTVEELGAIGNQENEREITTFQLKFFKNDLSRAVGVLGDAVSNNHVDSTELEAIRD